ncbi:flagellar biosynthesis/type III secretory pathway protein FliH [Burkholderia ambifaria]|nr:hypothetical protein [Burkholderia ambifaria]MDR6504018.1 flagellar biosynthesis/type III secretory pathway protein FliH [Burkholderia ambifaria]
MHFPILKTSQANVAIANDGHVLKAEHLQDVVWAEHLRSEYEHEVALVEQARNVALTTAREQGYREGIDAAQTELASRLATAGRWLDDAQQYFETAFAAAVQQAVAKVMAQMPDQQLMASVIAQAYDALRARTITSVTCHPSDRLHVEAAFNVLELARSFPLITLETMPRFSCRIDSPLATVEHGLEPILAGIEAAVRSAMLAARTSCGARDATRT